jgi:hypothetical protein
MFVSKKEKLQEKESIEGFKITTFNIFILTGHHPTQHKTHENIQLFSVSSLYKCFKKRSFFFFMKKKKIRYTSLTFSHLHRNI